MNSFHTQGFKPNNLCFYDGIMIFWDSFNHQIADNADKLYLGLDCPLWPEWLPKLAIHEKKARNSC